MGDDPLRLCDRLALRPKEAAQVLGLSERSLRALLPELLYFFDACHTGVYGWSVFVTTDCAMSPVSFRAEGSSKGAKATEEVGRIAGCMAEYLDDQPVAEEESSNATAGANGA